MGPAGSSRTVRYPRVAVNAIIFNAASEVLLTLRRDVPLWCLPGGLLECGETVANAVRRELCEEIGVQAEPTRVTGIYSTPNVHPVFPARDPTIVIALECRIVSGVPDVSAEVAEVNYFPLSSLPRMVPTHPGRIKDAAVRSERAVLD